MPCCTSLPPSGTPEPYRSCVNRGGRGFLCGKPEKVCIAQHVKLRDINNIKNTQNWDAIPCLWSGFGKPRNHHIKNLNLKETNGKLVLFHASMFSIRIKIIYMNIKEKKQSHDDLSLNNIMIVKLCSLWSQKQFKRKNIYFLTWNDYRTLIDDKWEIQVYFKTYMLPQKSKER